MTLPEAFAAAHGSLMDDLKEAGNTESKIGNVRIGEWSETALKTKGEDHSGWAVTFQLSIKGSGQSMIVVYVVVEGMPVKRVR